ncbi:MAG: hypothetical protein IJW99_12380, partial [Clostridia bacterium]|nr:hypothetical protein [Clostridia bacterium]
FLCRSKESGPPKPNGLCRNNIPTFPNHQFAIFNLPDKPKFEILKPTANPQFDYPKDLSNKRKREISCDVSRFFTKSP